MASITDITSESIARKLPGASEKAIKGGLKASKQTCKGICLVVKGGVFSLKKIIAAINRLLDLKGSGSMVALAGKNISIEKLQKSGNITSIDPLVSKEVMKPLNKLCRRYNVKYTAVYDKSTNEYKVFFNAKNTEVLDIFFKKASNDYMEKQQKMQDKSQKAEKRKESVRGKIKFFRDRVKKYNENRQKMKGKEHAKEDKSL